MKESRELIKNYAYLVNSHCDYDKSDYEIIILTDYDTKVGGILRYGTVDVQFIIFDEFRNKHYLSNFLKTGIMQKIWLNNEITICVDTIENYNDYKKKIYLVELTGYKFSNKEIVDEHVNKYLKK